MQRLLNKIQVITRDLVIPVLPKKTITKIYKYSQATNLMANILTLFLKNQKAAGNPRTTTFINHYSYLIARENFPLFDQFDVIHCDGIIMCLFLRLIGVSKTRHSFDMTSLAPLVFNEAIKNSKRIYLIGGESGIAEIAAKKIKAEFPLLNLVGMHEGFFTAHQDREATLQLIAKTNPDIVIASMGTPYQEQFLIDLRASGWTGEGFTSGGFFHQIAGAGLNYYPNWINKFNLRWAYRIYDEPKLVRRYTIDFGRFIFFFLKDLRRIKNKSGMR